jgi:hypothetical protein
MKMSEALSYTSMRFLPAVWNICDVVLVENAQ